MTANSTSSTSTKMVLIASTSIPLSTTMGSLSRDEIETFRRFVSQLDHSSTGATSSFAYTGTSALAFSASTSSSSCS